MNALPAPAAQIARAGNPPALPDKAWLLMDFDSGEILAAAYADEPLPSASLTKMMTSYMVERALRLGKLKPTDLVSVSQNALCRGTSTESCMYLPLIHHRQFGDDLVDPNQSACLRKNAGIS